MPLAFESISHGTLPFGFFNIQSDMLLLDRYFLFASDFCKYIADMAAMADKSPFITTWAVHIIEQPEHIGDLHAAIHGVRFTGFIGDVYLRFPFPEDPKDFKQNPEGFQTQTLVSELIATYAQLLDISVAVPSGGQKIDIGVYRFDRLQFQKLMNYVWRGGYPRWKYGTRPDYVLAMKEKILKNFKGLFYDIQFDE